MNATKPYRQPTGTPDNHARAYAHLSARPLASAMGAEILGVDLARMDAPTFTELTHALYRHKMIFVRDQALSFTDQEILTARFGDFGADAYTAGIPGHPHIQRVRKRADERAPLIFGGSWHTDSPFLARPPAISILYGIEIPPYGGDTLWANTVQALAALSDTLQTMLRSLRVHMSGRNVFAALRSHATTDAPALASMALDLREQALIDGALHPLIRTHPVTGERSLYVDETYAVGIAGMSDYEAAPLLEFLCAHVTQPLFQCRLRWEPRTVALWDNRTCLHHAFNDHDGFPREMLRTIVAGEIPV